MKKFLFIFLLLPSFSLAQTNANPFKIHFGLSLNTGAHSGILTGMEYFEQDSNFHYNINPVHVGVIEFQLYFLTSKNFLLSFLASSSGPNIMGGIGFGGLALVKNTSSELLRIGGSVAFRFGYSDFYALYSSLENGVYSFYNVENDYTIGFEPTLYVNYNHFLWGFSLGVEYNFTFGTAYFTSFKWGFLI